MSVACIVFPHHLFENNPALENADTVFVVEESLFFQQYNFHKQKVLFHRASMQYYASLLRAKEYKVRYVSSHEEQSDIRILIQHLQEQNIHTIQCCYPDDNWLKRRIESTAQGFGIRVQFIESPMFYNSIQHIENYAQHHKRLFQTEFYIESRKRFDLLVTEQQQPAGGKWSFDAENRKKYPKRKSPPPTTTASETTWYTEARTYTQQHFAANVGELQSHIVYPHTHEQAQQWLDEFLQQRFHEFGDYEDAIVSNQSLLHHSLVSPLLNIGLLTPQYVVSRAIEFAQQHNVSMNSLEGFVRQIVGWREFIRLVYHTYGSKERSTNFYKHNRPIPPSFWNASTGILPIDTTISKVLKTGYCHHIERLMILGNFMLLCEFHPHEVYRWFMEMFIDSYDWVMVPNVYGMSQFADGGLMATKPYISSSNYIKKMSDYPNGEWQKIWDALFWRFMHRNRTTLRSNPRLAMLLSTFDSMQPIKRETLLYTADEYLHSLE